MEQDDKDFFYDLAKFQATILTTRGSFMLVFQSMLLTSVAIVTGRPTPFGPLNYLLLLGLLTSLIWIYMNYLTRVIETKAWSRLLEIDPRVAELAQEGPFSGRLGDIAWFMSYPFPGLLATYWVILLVRGAA